MAKERKYPVYLTVTVRQVFESRCWFFSIFREDTDKVYFRKKDEISDYAEFMFKAKILLVKKWPMHTQWSDTTR